MIHKQEEKKQTNSKNGPRGDIARPMVKIVVVVLFCFSVTTVQHLAPEMKNTLAVFSSRLDVAKEKINEIEDAADETLHNNT